MTANPEKKFPGAKAGEYTNCKPMNDFIEPP